MHENLRRAEQHIERNLQNNPHDLHSVVNEVRHLRETESHRQFGHDLHQLNKDLHQKGYLPNLEIVHSKNREGFDIRPTREALHNREGFDIPPNGESPHARGQYGPPPEETRHHGRGPRGRRGARGGSDASGEEGPGGASGSFGDRNEGPMGPSGPGFTGRRANGDSPAGADPRTGSAPVDMSNYNPKNVMQNAAIVAQVAKEKGVDPATAVAAMLVESGGNARAIGDRGTSHGLFQLHKGGELGNLTPQQAYNPVTNANVALSEFTKHAHRGSPGEIAAAAQRPANPHAYAAKVNRMYATAERILQNIQYS